MKYKINDVLNENKLPNAFLLYGSEGYLKRQFKDRIVKIILGDINEFNFSLYTNSSGKVSESEKILPDLINDSKTMSFMSEKKVIVCENTGFFKNKFVEIPEFIESIPDFSYLIFIEKEINKATKAYKSINQVGFTEEYNLPDDNVLNAWVKSRLKKEDLSISYSALTEFIQATKINMDNIDNELNKLIFYKLDGGEISLDDVNAICVKTYEEEIFNIINAIARRDKNATLREYKLLYMLKTNPRQILNLIINKFNQLYYIKEALLKNTPVKEIQSSLAIKNDYAMKKNMEAARLFDINAIKEILDMSMEISYKLNTGLIGPETGIEIFLLKSLKA